MSRASFDVRWEEAQAARYNDQQSHVIPSELVAKVRLLYKARRKRDRMFADAILFADPAWDIMLGLYIDEGEGRVTSISAACIWGAVPPTTALRWIDKMVSMSLITRRDDPFDARRSFLSLTAAARDNISHLLGF